LKQFLFYSHSAQQFFVRHIEKYGGIIAPFSIAASFPATHAFFRALLSKDRTKEFALDPRSALFQHKWNRQKKLRDPHRKAAEHHGGPFTSVALKRRLQPGDMTPRLVERFTRTCLEYQNGFRVFEEEQRKLEKYRKLVGVDFIPEIQNPQRLIPPYFQFTGLSDRWYRATMKCNEAAAKIVSPQQLTPIIHFGKWLQIANWDTVLSAMISMNISSAFIYPNDFKEHEAEQAELKCYARCVGTFGAKKFTLFGLHGGYFAILLSKKGLSGFGNGVGYGEWRDSGYHRGGTPEIRIYVPKLHRFLDPPSAQAIVSSNPDYFTSDSELLAGYSLAAKPLTEVGAVEALDHFMECRRQEMQFVQSHTLAEAIAELRQTSEALRKIGPLQFDQYGLSLERWATALEI
jgi:hypothetical protein